MEISAQTDANALGVADSLQSSSMEGYAEMRGIRQLSKSYAAEILWNPDWLAEREGFEPARLG